MDPDAAGSPPGTADLVRERVARATAGLVPGGLDWARKLDDLAEDFLRAGQALPPGDALAPLDAAIAVRRHAIEYINADLTGTVGLDLRNNLAVDLSSRYQDGGGLADLLEACALGREVLAGSGPDDLLASAANLAGRLSLLARGPGYRAELDDAIGLLRDALARAGDDDPDRGVAVASLAGLELHRWQRDGDLTALASAARAADAAVRAGEVTAATPGAVNVAALLAEHGEQAPDTRLLAEAEGLLRQVAEEGPPRDAVSAQSNLAAQLVTRFDLEGGEALLEEAIELATEAMDARPPGPGRAEDLSARATARAALARLRGEPGLLAAAIADARAAVAEPETHAADPSGPVNSLAMLLAERYDLLGDSIDLDESIALHDALLDSPAVAADARPAIAANLANALLARFERNRTHRDRIILDRAHADLRRAADLADGAIERTPPGSVHLAARHDTAGRIRWALGYHQVPAGSSAGPAEDPAEQGELAERHAQAAVAVTPRGSPDRAHYLNNWGMWVTDRWERTADPAVLDEAIGLLEAALAAVQGDGQLRATIRFNLGVRLQEKFELAHERGDADLPTLQRACDLLDDVLAADLPSLTVPAGKRLGDIAMSLGMWPQAEHALRLALAAAGDLTGVRPLRPDKQRARSGVQGIGALAALCAVRAGDAQAAALHLEQSSATLLAESLGVRADTVTFGDITSACQAMGRSVLYLGGTTAGGLAVLIGADGSCAAAELPALTDTAVRSATSTFRRQLADALAGDVAHPDDGSDLLGACYAAGGQLLDWTWQSVLAPLGGLLAGTGRLAVLPLGALAWLPVTAAGPPGGPPALAAHEQVLLIRATAGPAIAGGPPSGESALAASAAAAPGPLSPAGSPARETVRDRTPRVLVWADTGPADRAIPGVLDEARAVAALYPGARLRLHDRQAATRVPLRGAAPAVSPGAGAGETPPTARAAAEAVATLREADIVHLACHCDVDPARPEETVLQLDPPVRVGDMGMGALDARSHVVLSACDAALTATSLPDEALSPAAALLLAGAGTVTAPVWPVDDEPTAEFMADYHRHLAAGAEPGQALSRVQVAWSATRPPFLYAPWVVVIRPRRTATP
jgi:hypothetical protein